MLHNGWKQLRLRTLAGAVSMALAATLAPAPLVFAQSAPQTGMPDLTRLVDQVGPAVVNIRTLERSKGGSASPDTDQEMEDFFRRFFGQPLPGRPDDGQGDSAPQRHGVGSGFIITPDGFVLTNAHVVEDTDEVLVTLQDKREFKAKVVGSPDKRSDVAVLKIEATGLPYVHIGDSAKLKVGEWVMAIGSPFGLDNSVTAGIVSAKQRDTGDYLPLIQTDVPINPGNSGGPLINMRGEVVGINSQIYSRSGGFMGISFAVPIDEAIRVADQLRTAGHVTRGRIGVQIDEVGKDVAQSIGLGRPRGALVRAVEGGGPADKAGVEAGDIIVSFNGKAIERPTDLPRLVGNTKPGSEASMTVFRNGNYRDLQVQVAQLEPDSNRPAAGKGAGPGAAAAAAPLGLAVSNLPASQQQELGVHGGVLVQAVAGAAAKAGIHQGDVIVAIGNTQVANVAAFREIVAKLDKSKPVPVLLRRGELATYLLIRP